MKTTLATTKKEELYTKLVEEFMSNQKLKVSEEEKKKFLMLCLVNELNPRKKEVHAIQYGDKLTLVIAYQVFQQRAEATGLVAGWNMAMKKDAIGKIISGKIQIRRKDWTHPFETELDVADVKKDKNPLRSTNTYDMFRKQLIRIGFSSAFPQAVPVSDPEEVTEDQFYEKAKKAEAEVISTKYPCTPENQLGQEQLPIAQDFSELLLSFLPEGFYPESFEGGPAEDQIDEFIKALQVEIGKRFIKDRSIHLDKEDIKTIFIGEDKNVVAMKKEAMKLLSEIAPK